MKTSKKPHKGTKPRVIKTMDELLDKVLQPLEDWADAKDKHYVHLLLVDANKGLSFYLPLYQGQQYPPDSKEGIDAESHYEWEMAQAIYHNKKAYKTFEDVNSALDLIFETDPKNAHYYQQHDDEQEEA